MIGGRGGWCLIASNAAEDLHLHGLGADRGAGLAAQLAAVVESPARDEMLRPAPRAREHSGYGASSLRAVAPVRGCGQT
ncbi:unnamed protein product, partial [Brenthis ino]